MGDRDARTLSEGFSEFDSKDLQSLGIGEAIGRIEQAKYDFSLKTYPLPEADEEEAQYKTLAIKKVSRENYATPLSDVEALLNKNRVGATDKKQANTQNQNKSDSIKSDQPSPVYKPQEKGKDGEQHKQIQKLLQQTAHDKGFSAVIEKHIGNGQHVDLVIKTNDKEIACEISISTSVDHEVDNLQKCINAGFSTIWSISDNADHVQAIENSHANNQVIKDSEINFYTSDQAQQALMSIENKFEAQTVRGFRLDKSWQDIEQAEISRREKNLQRSLNIKQNRVCRLMNYLITDEVGNSRNILGFRPKERKSGKLSRNSASVISV